MADKLAFSFNFWPGEYKPELEERFLLDGLVNPGTNDKILNTPWTGANVIAAPLSLHYFKDIKTEFMEASIVAGGRFIIMNPAYKYKTIYIRDGYTEIQDTNFKNSIEMNLDSEVGLQIPLLEKKLLLTPMLGRRDHSFNARLSGSGMGIGPVNIAGANFNGIKLLNRNRRHNKLEAAASGNYFKIAIEFKIDNKFSIIGDYTHFQQMKGEMSQEFREDYFTLFNSATTSGLNISYFFTQNKADYVQEGKGTMLGLKYNISDTFHLQVGIRTEKMERSYPNFWGYSAGITFTASGIITQKPDLRVNDEFKSDFIFYGMTQTAKKGSVYFGVTIDTEFK